MSKIFIATHKSYEFPLDSGYQPIHVGKKNCLFELGKGVIGDDEGNSISELNSSYCELTALYWVWKNISEDIIGLVHYRRYFSSENSFIKINSKKVAASNDFDFNKYDIVVAKKRNYFITNVENHYCKSHYKKDFEIMKAVVENLYPDYSKSFSITMSGRELSLYNMFVGKSDVIGDYCSWLFPILREIDHKIDSSNYDAYQKRVLGFMAERLFNVWLEYNKNRINISYRKVVNIEGESLIKKGVAFIFRQFFSVT